MILCLDVGYSSDSVRAAAVTATAWSDAAPALEWVIASDRAPAAYQPGRFFERELPYLLDAIARVDRASLAAVVVDAYVWLADDAPGLGARLHEALGEAVPVVGVAKTSFHGATRALQVLRGKSTQPLYVTAAGMTADAAATHVASMHGAHRVPALLRRVDQLARGLAEPRGATEAAIPARRR